MAGQPGPEQARFTEQNPAAGSQTQAQRQQPERIKAAGFADVIKRRGRIHVLQGEAEEAGEQPDHRQRAAEALPVPRVHSVRDDLQRRKTIEKPGQEQQRRQPKGGQQETGGARTPKPVLPGKADHDEHAQVEENDLEGRVATEHDIREAHGQDQRARPTRFRPRGDMQRRR